MIHMTLWGALEKKAKFTPKRNHKHIFICPTFHMYSKYSSFWFMPKTWSIQVIALNLNLKGLLGKKNQVFKSFEKRPIRLKRFFKALQKGLLGFLNSFLACLIKFQACLLKSIKKVLNCCQFFQRYIKHFMFRHELKPPFNFMTFKWEFKNHLEKTMHNHACPNLWYYWIHFLFYDYYTPLLSCIEENNGSIVVSKGALKK